MEKIKEDSERNGWIKNAVTFLLNRLPIRFPLNIDMVCAAIVDPEIQHLSAIDEWLEANNESRVSALRRVAHELDIAVDTETALESTTKMSTDELSNLIKKHSRVMKQKSNIESELDCFRNIAQETPDVLNFWFENEAAYPCMAKIAKMLLSKPATSAKAESAFSVAGALLRHRRASIHPLRVQKTLFVHDDYKILRPEFHL